MVTLIAAVLVLGGTAAMTPLLATDLLGRSGENSMTVRQALPAGTSLADTSAAAVKVEDVLRGIDGIKDVQVTSGNAQTGFTALTSSGASNSSFTVVTEEKANQAQAPGHRPHRTGQGRRRRQDLRRLPAGRLRHVVHRGHHPQGRHHRRPPDGQRRHGQGHGRASPAAREVATNLAASQPVVQVKVDRAKAVAAGLNEEQVAGVLASTISPIPAGTVRIDTNDFPVRIGEGTRFTSIAAVRNIPLPTAAGAVPLGSIAAVEQVDVPVSITASNGQRTAQVSVTPSGANLGAVSTEVQNRLKAVELPPGVTAEIGGATTQQAESFRQLGLALLAAIAIVYVIMVAAFKSLIQPLILLVSVPFAATGRHRPAAGDRGAAGAAVADRHADAGGHCGDQRDRADRPHQPVPPAARTAAPGMSVADAITHGARQRLRPILMTALATVFALTPMALGLTGGGGFISQPLAIVVIGGLVSSTALTLVLVPVLYRLVEGRRERKALLRALQERPGFRPGRRRRRRVRATGPPAWSPRSPAAAPHRAPPSKVRRAGAHSRVLSPGRRLLPRKSLRDGPGARRRQEIIGQESGQDTGQDQHKPRQECDWADILTNVNSEEHQ